MSNSEARNAIFASIRQNLAASLPFDAVHQAHHRQKEFDFASTFLQKFPKETLIENFRQNLESVGGNFLRVSGESEATEVLSSIIGEQKVRKIAFSDSPLVKRLVGFLKIDAEFIENAETENLFESDLGITGAQMAIAETGTLVLESDGERHRLTSLVPPVHVCILESQNIHQSLGEVLEILQKDLSKTITFITGASRTSDIELTLAIGVHGPGELHVILIDKAGEIS